jgi:hypothetical protein
MAGKIGCFANQEEFGGNKKPAPGGFGGNFGVYRLPGIIALKAQGVKFW